MNEAERLHLGFLGEPFLFKNFRLDSFGSFIAAASLVAAICLSERILTLGLSRRWNPLPIFRRTRLRVSAWRAFLYWVVALERMLYMLTAMSLNLWILIVIVTSLAVGQFIVELTEDQGTTINRSYPESGYLLPRHSQDVNGLKEPLLATPADDFELNSASTCQREHLYQSQQTRIPSPVSPENSHLRRTPSLPTSPSFQYTPPLISEQTAPDTTRPRSKSKPDGIFIHPTHSNIARAEVIAVRMGLDTEKNEYVDSSSYTYPGSPSQSSDMPAQENRRGWGAGNGRDIARELLGGTGTNAGW